MLAGALVLATGCATVTAPTGAAPTPVAPAPASRASRIDPWERLNRQIFGFNEALDEAVAEPLARAYKAVLPDFARQGVGNFFSNVGDGWSAVNHLLQGKLESSFEMSLRFLANTVLGVVGLFDPATDLGLERQQEDFGQTLGRWGIAPGPYLVLPIFGPSSLRDGFALSVDYAAARTILHVERPGSFVLTGLELIHSRSNLLAAGRLLDQVALDKYSFLRDAYLSRRKGLVYDGDPPEEPEEPEEPDDAVGAGAPQGAPADGAVQPQ